MRAFQRFGQPKYTSIYAETLGLRTHACLEVVMMLQLTVYHHPSLDEVLDSIIPCMARLTDGYATCWVA